MASDPTAQKTYWRGADGGPSPKTLKLLQNNADLASNGEILAVFRAFWDMSPATPSVYWTIQNMF